jgi:hypothetical protein
MVRFSVARVFSVKIGVQGPYPSKLRNLSRLGLYKKIHREFLHKKNENLTRMM